MTAWLDVGETRDVEFRATRGDYRLMVGEPAKPDWTQELRVR